MPFNQFRPTSPDYSDTVAGGVRDTSGQAFDLLLKLLSAVGEVGNASQSMGNAPMGIGAAAMGLRGVGKGADASARLLKNLRPRPMGGSEAVADKAAFMPELAAKLKPLVTAAQAGDTAAMEQLAVELQPLLRKVSMGMESRAKAQGVTGWNADDALSALGEKLPDLVQRYDPTKGEFPNFMAAQGRGVARNELRGQRQREFIEGQRIKRMDKEGGLREARQLEAPGSELSDQSNPEGVASAFSRLDLSKLTANQRKVIEAYMNRSDEAETVWAEVARDSGLPVKNVKTTFNDAMVRLRAQMSAKPMSGGSTSQYPEPDPNIVRQLSAKQNLSDTFGVGVDPASRRHPLVQRDEASLSQAKYELTDAGYNSHIEPGDFTPGMPMSSSVLEPAPGVPGEWIPARGTARPIMDIKWESWDQTPESPSHSLRRPR